MDENANLQQMEATDDWADVDLSDVTDNDTPESAEHAPEAQAEANAEADQQGQALSDAGAPSAEKPAAEAETDQFTLKHLDETRTVSREEVIALAQKGMDYDRIRQRLDAQKDYDTMRERLEELEEHEAFLKEIAGDNGIDALIDEGRANSLMQREGLDHDTALGRARLDRERKQFEAERRRQNDARQAAQQAQEQEQQATEQREQWRQACFLEFARQFPDVDPKAIPQEVYAAFAAGETLVSAYSRTRLKELERQQAQQRQAEENAKRSTGSRRTDGGTEKMSAFDAAWYDGT